MKKHILIAAGGTGGHMFPAQSLAEAMLALGWRVTLSTDARGATHAGGFPDAVTRTVVSAATFARGGLLSKIAAAPRIAMGILAARRSLKADRPDVVAGFGGYPALPAMAAAWSLGVPRIIHEQNGVLGRVNALFAARVHKVACSLWPTELPKGANAVHTGNPVRSSVRRRAATPYPPMDGPLNILIVGGSQGASILSRVVPGALAALPSQYRDRLVVSHQARDADRQEVLAAYEAARISHVVEPFFSDLPERLAAAHLVISRSGASSVADITTIGRPSILVPLAIAIRDEQTANGAPVVAAKAGVMLPEDRFTPERLQEEILSILSDPQKAQEMARNAAAIGRPDAVDRLRDVVLELADAT